MRFCFFQIYIRLVEREKVKTNVHEIIQSKVNRISAEYATTTSGSGNEQPMPAKQIITRCFLISTSGQDA